MKALFIGQSYIDITFVTDHMPSGDEKHLGNEASPPTLAQINETASRFGERRQTPVQFGLVPERDKRATKPATLRR
jgi:hypothetical protein